MWLLVCTIVASGCASGAQPAPESAPEPTPESTPVEAETQPTTTRELDPELTGAPERLSEDPVEAIRSLRILASGGHPTAVDAYLDTDFTERLPSAAELSRVLGPVPEGCDVELTQEEGYGAVAIPPPMVGDSAEQIAETEAIIAILQNAVEVYAGCTILEEPEIDEDGPTGDPVQQEMPVFAIALRRDERVGWRVLAWRYFIEERTLHH